MSANAHDPASAPSSSSLAELLRRRRSSRAFAPTPVSPETIAQLMDAASSASSSMNEQPWRFVVAPKTDAASHERLAETLLPGNRQWAENAPLLMLVLAQTHFSRTGKPNRHALYDAGQAVSALALRATDLGLCLRQMGGLDVAVARTAFSVPDDVEVVCAIALGYPGDRKTLPEPLQAQEEAPRSRRPRDEFVFQERFGNPASI